MNSLGQLKKTERKLKRLQHIVTKETDVICVNEPTKILVICNSGLVNGLTEEIVVQNFEKYGALDNIVLVPGKSCSFISYRELESATAAFTNCNGKLNIAQDNKPIYLSYVQKMPDIQENKQWDNRPNDLTILENFISEEEEKKLLLLCNFNEDINSGTMKNRQVKHYGFEFRYDINNVYKDQPLDEKIPDNCKFLWDKLQMMNLPCKCFIPDQLTINYYSPGQGIPHHIDTHSAFEDPILSLSLSSMVVMDFKNDSKHICVPLSQRSLLIMSGESRYDWTHGITPRKFDIIKTNNGFTTIERKPRISFTFRKVLQGECNCKYYEKCDSYQKRMEAKIENAVASKLEQTHVHDVYENIASHFSDTRHKPWPNVLNFVQSFEYGSVFVDIGCGNGKYLGYNKKIFEMGCDRSFGLIDVCKKRGFQAFGANCLNVPLKDNVADGAISIAVIHHLANEERRFRAIKEMIRILKVGGKALIYVWAKDQHKDTEKSSYIKQDRKNRKNNDVIIENTVSTKTSTIDGVSLPVHINRTQFKHKDVLVPWKLKTEEKKDNTFLRFYHVFEEFELEQIISKISNVKIIKSYYDQGNWCVIFQKINVGK